MNHVSESLFKLNESCLTIKWIVCQSLFKLNESYVRITFKLNESCVRIIREIKWIVSESYVKLNESCKKTQIGYMNLHFGLERFHVFLLLYVFLLFVGDAVAKYSKILGRSWLTLQRCNHITVSSEILILRFWSYSDPQPVL